MFSMLVFPSPSFWLMMVFFHNDWYTCNHVYARIPNKHNTLNQCWFDVGKPFTTLGQHITNIGSCFAFVELFCHVSSGETVGAAVFREINNQTRDKLYKRQMNWSETCMKEGRRLISPVVLFEAVDWCICFTRKIQHGGDWKRSRPQGPKNVHNFLLTVRPPSRARGHGTKLLLILKKIFSTCLFRDKSYMWPYKKMSYDFVRGQSVAETCFTFTPLTLNLTPPN